MRDYSAHHDCLDEQLVYSKMGLPGLEGLLVVTLRSLAAWR